MLEMFSEYENVSLKGNKILYFIELRCCNWPKFTEEAYVFERWFKYLIRQFISGSDSFRRMIAHVLHHR